MQIKEMVMMRRSHVVFAVVTAILMLAVAACGSESQSEASPAEPAPAETAAPEPAPAAPAAEEPAVEEPAQDEAMDEEPAAGESADPPYEDVTTATFGAPLVIDNELYPLRSGTQWVYEGSTLEDGEEVPHRIEFTVTNLTKEIDGVQTVVAQILDISDGEVAEAEIAFYAQADDGTVWYFGEYPEVYEDGEFVESEPWISGKQEARAGIHMPANPQEGDPDYAQGWAPAIDWTDRAQVYKTGQETCVAAGCFDDVVIMDEWSEGEPGFKLKSYTRGVGEVQVGFRGPVEDEEALELVEVSELDQETLDEIEEESMELDRRAYNTAEEIWADTAPVAPA